MARKKKEPEKKKLTPQNVEGLHAEVLEQPITDTLTVNYMPYAMSVIVSRAIPEIDGFKPSHRKLLYTMYKMGLLNGARRKSADIVGQTMGLNPHGDAAIYETMVRLARGNEALLAPFVDSKGNFGKVYSRDMAYAASRYTEAKLEPICAEIFRDIDSETVDFVDNYSNTMKEPVLLPTAYPNVLVSANTGIAVGMASNICGFNLREVCNATAAWIKNPDCDLLELMPEYNVKGIVFSSSCTVYGEPDKNPVDENAPIKKATSPYGNTKQISEEIITDAINSGVGYKSIILRYFNPVGAHPSAEIGELPNGVPQNLIPYLTQTAIGIRKELSVFGDDYDTPDGSCIRDFINVVDLAKAHVVAISRMLDNPDTDPIEIFNLGTGSGVSVLELINTFETATGVAVPHKIVGRREGDIEKVWADPHKANTVLGWKAETSLADTMKSAWKWQLRLREKGIM